MKNIKLFLLMLFSISSGMSMDTDQLKKWKLADDNAGRLFRFLVFDDLMGKSEDLFVKDAGKYGGLASLDLEKYKSNDPWKKWAVDKKQSPFNLETVGELKKQFAQFKKKNNPALKPGEITLIDGFAIRDDPKQGLMDALRETDIRYLQAQHPGGVFQIASNFNCLEGGVGTGTLSHMIKMAVQGENAVFGTLGGGFIRKLSH